MLFIMNQIFGIKQESFLHTIFKDFIKDTFIDCTEVKLILPQKSDYLKYDDQSHVVDDIKEDEKWCGIKIDSEFLPQFLVYKINNV